jgi:hypothetical protein
MAEGSREAMQQPAQHLKMSAKSQTASCWFQQHGYYHIPPFTRAEKVLGLLIPSLAGLDFPPDLAQCTISQREFQKSTIYGG